MWNAPALNVIVEPHGICCSNHFKSFYFMVKLYPQLQSLFLKDYARGLQIKLVIILLSVMQPMLNYEEKLSTNIINGTKINCVKLAGFVSKIYM